MRVQDTSYAHRAAAMKRCTPSRGGGALTTQEAVDAGASGYRNAGGWTQSACVSASLRTGRGSRRQMLRDAAVARGREALAAVPL
jgi:hypothetical protein